MADFVFNIKGKSENATKLVAEARNFKIIIDEPEQLGGYNQGPNPVEYILAGYAGCLNVVIHLLAKEKKIDVFQLNIDIKGNINPNKLFGTENSERAGFKNIQVTIDIESSATKEEIESLIKDAKERCPVNDNLKNETPIEYLLKIPIINN